MIFFGEFKVKLVLKVRLGVSESKFVVRVVKDLIFKKIGEVGWLGYVEKD